MIPAHMQNSSELRFPLSLSSLFKHFFRLKLIFVNQVAFFQFSDLKVTHPSNSHQANITYPPCLNEPSLKSVWKRDKKNPWRWRRRDRLTKESNFCLFLSVTFLHVVEMLYAFSLRLRTATSGFWFEDAPKFSFWHVVNFWMVIDCWAFGHWIQWQISLFLLLLNGRSTTYVTCPKQHA